MGGPSPPPAPATPQLAPGSGAANYIPSNQPGIDTSYQQLFNSLKSGATGLTQFGIPAIYNYANNIQNNPYAAGAQSGAVSGSNYALGTQIPQLESAASNLTGLAQAGLPYGQQILQTGFDPQNSLYNRTAQQVTDQSNAINAMYGLGSSPAGAGLTQQALSNFNIDWQNQQLARQTQAAQGYSALATPISGLYQAGLGYTGQVAPTMTGATAIPYSTYNTLQTQPMGAIANAANTVAGLYNPTTAAMASALGYLGTGTNASAAFNNAVNQNYANQIAGYNAAANANSGFLGGLGGLVGGAFNVASNPLSLFGTSLWG